MGDYGKAEPLYTQALDMRRRLLGDEHLDVAATMSGPALTYVQMADYAKGEALCAQGLAMRRKLLGDKHPDVAASLSVLARLYEAMGEYAKAEPFGAEAVKIGREVYGGQDPRLVPSLHSLASICSRMGEYARAESLHTEALAIYKKVHGGEHPHVAMIMFSLGSLHHELGDYARAKSLYTQALAMRRKLLGEDHPHVAQSMNEFAGLYAATGRERDSLRLMRDARAITEKQIDMVMGFAAERAKLAFLRTAEADLERLLSLVSQHLSADVEAAAVGASVVLRAKGVTLDAVSQAREAIAGSDDPQLLRLFEQLARVRQRLAAATFGGLGKAGPAAYKQRLSALAAEKEKLEAQLSRRSSEFAAAASSRRDGASRIR